MVKPQGRLLYEMLAGRRLFEGSYPQIIHALGSFDEHTMEPLPGVPAPLWAILLRSLAAAPSDRFQTAQVEQALGAGVQAAILADPLPDGDLHAILRALRKNAATEDLPVYLILDREDPAVVTAALEAGADDVLMRPANVEVLIAKLRRAIHQRQAARRARSSPNVSVAGRGL